MICENYYVIFFDNEERGLRRLSCLLFGFIKFVGWWWLYDSKKVIFELFFEKKYVYILMYVVFFFFKIIIIRDI